jgi:hypothetical protein
MLELLGETQPPPFTAPPGTPPTFGFIPYMFIAKPDGSEREAVARAVVNTAWVGGRCASRRAEQRALPRLG